MTQPLFLVGPRGCGKTTVGLVLAEAVDFRFIDTDQWLQSQMHKTVADIVEREGWTGFRARETAALEAVTAPSTVVATGGGIILTEYNRHYMRSNGIVIYLCAPVSVLVNRLEASPEEELRPTLTGKPLSEEVQEVLEQRDILYREAAHFIIDATNQPAQVVSEIRTALAQTARRKQGGVYT
ncbi:shikimate kinase AroL [Citrobacter amalonaticus]|uniref:Shikimate kinase 2 n=1 Tax=Citrobacter amalonaticus TaxID=35703 RepID=A0A2S4S0M8_CITAM|nr:shikimate kinase AroL [Citrobacter amalonaticus]POT58451.1 shikimate kinase AroL [Citrobacter amalonaticus]POT76023.1 shikimate kinase AroL [Citrobacter amalonaticus]POU66978.1 shikimate kinase AroL [Citrobacter amalonaticus]POV05257.1 shikimate kinase AroL [Citrobacter amalonaticus]